MSSGGLSHGAPGEPIDPAAATGITMTTPSTSDPAARALWTPADALERLRVIVLAGISLGVLVGGVGGRLAMLILRLTSPDSVRGRISDDGFEIGRFTLSGSYSLLVVGAGFGLIGAAAYGLVAPWLIGPRWFRNLTVALGSGAVVGSMLVHADGIDFTLLAPRSLAIALFVAIPALFGGLIGPTLERFARPGSWTGTGRRRWLLPLIAAACFPPTLIVIAVIGCVLLAWSPMRASGVSQRVQAHVVGRTLLQGAWLLVAVVGLLSLIGDAQDIL